MMNIIGNEQQLSFSCLSPLPPYEIFLWPSPLPHPTLLFCIILTSQNRRPPSFLRALVSSADPKELSPTYQPAGSLASGPVLCG